MTALRSELSAEDAARVQALAWYHTIDVAPGVATDGWFDLRHALDRMPFPDVAGKRCLDVGTWDGFYAFEMERRGAAEVVAVDLPSVRDVDYPPAVRADPAFDPDPPAVQKRSEGFHLLHELLDSQVTWTAGNIYDLDPDVHGRFDVVVVGSLLVHLRDPVRALDAVRSVTAGELLLADYVHPATEMVSFGRPRFELRGQGSDFQWWLASSAGLRQLLAVAGFSIVEESDRFLLRHGPSQTPGSSTTVADRVRDVATRRMTGDAGTGHLHRAFRCRPNF